MNLTLNASFLPQQPARREPASRTQGLAKGALLRIDRPLGAVVQCSRGTVWVTHDGDPKDVVLEAGESYRSRSAARLIVQALEDSDLSLRT
ncbi:MAG: DUF2917 domain-containing protein [Burkholderiales bacterium]|nr:DUF2917 domain-containing protein [Burkholderiales bacterium]